MMAGSCVLQMEVCIKECYKIDGTLFSELKIKHMQILNIFLFGMKQLFFG